LDVYFTDLLSYLPPFLALGFDYLLSSGLVLYSYDYESQLIYFLSGFAFSFSFPFFFYVFFLAFCPFAVAFIFSSPFLLSSSS